MTPGVRSALRAVLLLVVAAALVVPFARGRGGAGEVAPSAVDGAMSRAKVVVTYFTTDVRCVSCRTIEALTKRAVEEGFADELARGELLFRVVNTSQPANAHFVDHYAITNKTVVVSRQRDGVEQEWSRCGEIWTLFREPERFLVHVREPIRRHLELARKEPG